MKKLIDINSYPVSVVLKALLKDKTTGKNIIFATSAYTENGRTINEKENITEDLFLKSEIEIFISNLDVKVGSADK